MEYLTSCHRLKIWDLTKSENIRKISKLGTERA